VSSYQFSLEAIEVIFENKLGNTRFSFKLLHQRLSDSRGNESKTSFYHRLVASRPFLYIMNFRFVMKR
jgi:hypothetical protein